MDFWAFRTVSWPELVKIPLLVAPKAVKSLQAAGSQATSLRPPKPRDKVGAKIARDTHLEKLQKYPLLAELGSVMRSEAFGS